MSMRRLLPLSSCSKRRLIQAARISASRSIRAHTHTHIHIPHSRNRSDTTSFPRSSNNLSSQPVKMDTNPMAQKARQKMQETPSERSTRSSSNFKSVESSMPKLGSTLRIVPLVDTFSSYLGLRNPLATEAHPPKDSVWLLDNTAYRPVHVYPHRQQPWHAEFMVAYFEPRSGKNLSAFVADIADKVGLADMDMSDDEGEKRIAERLMPFTNSIRPAKTVKVILPNGKQKKLGPGGRNGISTQTLGPLQEWRDGDVAQTKALKEEIAPLGPGITHFAEPEGWLVISGTLLSNALLAVCPSLPSSFPSCAMLIPRPSRRHR